MKLYLMQLATFGEQHFPVPAYLVQTDDGKNILIDTGVSQKWIEAAKGPQQGPMPIHEAHSIIDELAKIGLKPENIDYVISTHLDPDHSGNHAAFPNATIIIQKAHYELAKKMEHPRFAQTRDQWDNPGLHYEFVDGDTQFLPGIELIESSGHILGHQCVVVHLPETGPVLLAIDAIPRQAALDAENRTMGPFDQDEEGVRSTTRKLVALAEREAIAFIVFGHDAEQWRELKKLPEYYA